MIANNGADLSVKGINLLYGRTGLRKMALRKLWNNPSFCNAEREPALSEPGESIN